MTDKTDLPKLIYLIPDGDGYVWCEDPAPGVGMEEKDAVKYLSTEAFIEQACEAFDNAPFNLGGEASIQDYCRAWAQQAIRDRLSSSED